MQSSQSQNEWYLEEKRNVDSLRGMFVIQIINYAIHKDIIIGSSKEGYFIFNSIDNEPLDKRLKTYGSKDEWLIALQKYSIPQDIKLLNPEDVAKVKSDYELRPWKYSIMNNLLGFSDGDWGVFLILFVILISFALGFYAQKINITRFLPMFLGFLSGLANYIFIWSFADPAIGLLVTAIIFCPLLCWASYSLGKRIKINKIKQSSL